MSDTLFEVDDLNCLRCGRPLLGNTSCVWCLNKARGPLVPYAGTSGWSGSDTSKARAVTADSDGTTSKRQAATIRMMKVQAENGMTVAELRLWTGWHHGQASGVLSVLHKAGTIARLSESRSRCKVYTLPEYVNGRETEPHGRKPKDDRSNSVSDSPTVYSVCATCGYFNGTHNFACAEWRS